MDWKEQLWKKYPNLTWDFTGHHTPMSEFIETEIIEKLIEDASGVGMSVDWESGGGHFIFEEQLRASWLGEKQ